MTTDKEKRRNGLALHHVCSPIDKLPRAKAAGKWVSNEERERAKPHFPFVNWLVSEIDGVRKEKEWILNETAYDGGIAVEWLSA